MTGVRAEEVDITTRGNGVIEVSKPSIQEAAREEGLLCPIQCRRSDWLRNVLTRITEQKMTTTTAAARAGASTRLLMSGFESSS